MFYKPRTLGSIRLLVIGVRYPPETFLRRKFEALAARGFEVHVTSASNGLPARPENGVSWHQTPSLSVPLSVRFLSLVHGTLAALIRSPFDFLRLLKCITAQGYLLPLAPCRWIKFLGLSGFQPDVIHFEWNFTAVAHLPLFDYFGAPVVVSCRGSQIAVAPTSPARSMQRKGLAESLRRASRVHAVSEATRKQAIAAGAEPSHMVVIRPAIDTFPYQATSRQPAEIRPLGVISVGSLGWVKGYEFGLQALRYALDQGADLNWRIVGGGTHQERQRLLYTIQDLDLTSRVQLTGELPADSVRTSLRDADIFLLPSLSEGISNAALEAMATGLPVIATDVGGMSEAVIHGDSGLLVAPRDGRAMADALLLVARNSQLREELGRKARERVVQHFSLDRQTTEWEALYRGVVPHKAASRGRFDADPRPLRGLPPSTASGKEGR